MDSSSGSEWWVPRSLGSSLKELESPLDAWAELVDRLDMEAVEEYWDSGAGVLALIAFAIVFFFFSGGGRTTDGEARSFSSGALLNFPSCIFFLLLLKTLLASLNVHLACLFVKGKIPQDEVLPEYHDLRQSPMDDVEDVRLGFPDNRKQISGRKERVVVSFTGSDLE